MKLSWDTYDFPSNVQRFFDKYIQNMAFNSNKYKRITVRSKDGVFYDFEKDEEDAHLHFAIDCLQIRYDGVLIECFKYTDLEIELIK